MKKIIHITLLFGAYLMASAAQANTDLTVIRQLAKDGAPHLASQMITQAQPAPVDNIDGWVFFEQQRLELLHQWKEWDAIIERVKQVPIKAPIGFMRYAYLQQVNAYLQTNRPDEALVLLQELIWGDVSPEAQAQQQMYRRLLVRAYWLQERWQDVEISIAKFEQDYGIPNDAWRILKSRVLMRKQQYAQVMNLLKDVALPEAQAIRLLAHLKLKPKEYRAVVKTAQQWINKKTTHPLDQNRLQLVVAEAAKSFKTGLVRTSALESIVKQKKYLPQGDELFQFNPSRLWQAYLDYGYADGNQQRLLVGDDKKWFKRAKPYLKKHPQKSRALYSVVMKDSPNEAAKNQAFTLFAKSLSEDNRAILPFLFSPNGQILSWESVPQNVRFLLVDDALKVADYSRAGRILRTLKEPPKGVSDLDWGLQHARVKILNAKPKDSAQLLVKLIQKHQAELDKASIDRVVQVVFDLQAVNAHTAAVDVLAALLINPMPVEQQRELLFWVADSFKALADYPRAAAYYLRSATVLDGFGFDIWGQTARYQAAEVLLEAGLYDDAERQFNTLLRVTKDARRRALITQQIQTTKLKANNKTPK